VTVWIPFRRDVCGITTDEVVHAVDPVRLLAAGKRRRRTVDTLCGHQRARLLTVEAVNTDGDPIGHSAMSWPPPARKHTRCPDCLAATGNPRPHPSWRHLRNPETRP
jgi:hypothetical protein